MPMFILPAFSYQWCQKNKFPMKIISIKVKYLLPALQPVNISGIFVILSINKSYSFAKNMAIYQGL